MQQGRNFAIVIRFLGTNYHGWQIQSNSLTIQEVFQNALSKICKSRTDIKGCSRTDAGVHANVYCISATLSINIDPENLILAMNKFLPDDIRVIKCFYVSSDFHARYSCLAKEYIYKIYNYKIMDPFMVGRSLHFRYNLDLDLISDLCNAFVGYHDFTSFCSLDRRCTDNMFRTISYFDVKKFGNIVEFKVKSDGFLYNMVRILIGTVLKGNYKKMSRNDMVSILGKKNRKFAGPTLSPCGLYLNKIFYEEFTL